jgi:hypothetical protein
VQKIILTLVVSCFAAASINAVQPSQPQRSSAPAPAPAQAPAAPAAFTFRDANGNAMNVPLVEESAKRKMTAKVDPRLNPSLTKAATIAQERAHARSKSKCWRYVKQALLASGAIESYPKTALAKQAGDELVREHGFTKLPINDPYAAPVGAVIVYTAKGAPGHVEIRTKDGFVSDFKTDKPSKRKLIGVYAKA